MAKTTDLRKFGEDLITFKEDVVRLLKDYREGRVFETGEILLEKANEEDVIEASCVRDIPDVSFFSLGPVYVTAQVPFSILDQYTAEVEQEQFLTIETQPFAEGLDVIEGGRIVGTWGNKIQAVSKDKLDQITDFICSQVFVSPQDKLIGVRIVDAMIQDPVLRSKHGVHPDNLMRIRLFLPYSVKGCVEPEIKPDGIVTFKVGRTPLDLKRALRPALIAQKEKEKSE